MKIALVGGSGFVGSALLQELLHRGHEVTALARHVNKIAPQENLTVVEADAYDASQVAKAVSGADAVVSAFNPGWTNPNIYDDFLRGAKAIQEGTKQAGVKRLLVVGGAGSLYDEHGQQLVDSPHFPKEIFNGANGARDYLASLQTETQLDWTLLSPPPALQLGSIGERTGKYRTGKDSPLSTNGGLGTISAADLAVALIDELENPHHPNARFTVAY